MKVLKFGGSSVSDAAIIRKTTSIVRNELEHGDPELMVVLSAFGGVTDGLLRAGTLASKQDDAFKTEIDQIKERHLKETKELLPASSQSAALSRVIQLFNQLESVLEGIYTLGELSPRSKDRIMAFGELLSTAIVSSYWSSQELLHEWVDARRVIATNDAYGNALVDFKLTEKNLVAVRSATDFKVRLFPGFIGSAPDGSTTTLGRGGSDYTAALLAALANADELQIWTDVSGMMTADPRLCANVKSIPRISYQEAMELSHFGAKVIYPPTIQPVMSLGIPIRVKNTYAPDDEGTLIEKKSTASDDIVCGLSSIANIALLLLEGSGMIGIAGFSRRLFEALSREKINVVLITQSSSEHSICVAVDERNTQRASVAVNEEFAAEIMMQKLQPVQTEGGLSIVALVGDQMKSHPGISGRMFSALGRNGVNIRAIAQGSSEKNISAVIRTPDVKKAINVLHEAFFESSKIQINVFVVGIGNVGSRLMDQLLQQRNFLLNQRRIQLNVVGIANSKRVVLSEDGIDLHNWKQLLDQSQEAGLQKMVEFISEKNLRNSIFVDITANDAVTHHYEQLLRQSVSVVACNKIAASSSMKQYKKLKRLAAEFNTSFLFETNVGAGLPVIGTLNDLLTTGDEITRIQAVLSGTLTFVFNNYDGTRSFAEVVRQAQQEGYTEPDPRIDLSGVDVMRKILILAREAGRELDIEQIVNRSFLPESCMKGSVEDFYKELERHEAHFLQLYKAASDADCRLKFVAELDGNTASVGLQHIDKSNNLYHLYGKDNVVLFYTNRYVEQPLVIKGAGAGAEVTASGIFADIMRAALSN